MADADDDVDGCACGEIAFPHQGRSKSTHFHISNFRCHTSQMRIQFKCDGMRNPLIGYSNLDMWPANVSQTQSQTAIITVNWSMKDRLTVTSKDRDSVFAALQQVYLQLLRTCTRSYANYACMHDFLTRHRGGRNPPQETSFLPATLVLSRFCVLIYLTAVLLVNGESLLLQRFKNMFS